VLEKKKTAPRAEIIYIKRTGLYTAGDKGRRFKRGEAVKVIKTQKEDFTKAGISPAFLETLKLNKHV
jgi:hypothetical protein